MRNKNIQIKFSLWAWMLTALFFLFSHDALAQQQGTVIYYDDFGSPSEAQVRRTWEHMPQGFNTFLFAHPDAPNIDNKGYSEAKAIENDFYAVVGPKYIYSSVGLSDSEGWENVYRIWDHLVSLGDATPGHNGDGGALIVNGGNTKATLDARFIDLEAGKYYKLSYQLYVENHPVQLKASVVSGDGASEVAAYTHPDNNQGTKGEWTEQVSWFFLPTNCGDGTFGINLSNAFATPQNNDFAIDELKLEVFDALPSDAVEWDEEKGTIKCGMAIPTAVDDVYALDCNAIGNEVNLSPLVNDKDVTGAQASVSTVSVSLDVPAGAQNNLSEYEWGGADRKQTVTIAGEGVWELSDKRTAVPGPWPPEEYTYSDLVITFTPEAGFEGNPTPITYLITDRVTGGAARARISITYDCNPSAEDDNASMTVGQAVTIPILDNDVSINAPTVDPANVTVRLIDPFTKQEGTTITVPNEGVWTYEPSTGLLTFTPESGFEGTPTPITYTFEEGGKTSNAATVRITVSSASPILCTEDIQGESFQWSYPNGQPAGQSTVSQTITQPGANGGFIFDIYELDNSFNMNINGTLLATQEIEFQSNGTDGINTRFKDGDEYETNTEGEIWQMTGEPGKPLIRVAISSSGAITMFGSKVSSSNNDYLLEPLELFDGNSFNTINWNESTNNEIVVTQNVVGATKMIGYGSGQNIVPCDTYIIEKEGLFNDENGDGLAQVGETITYTLTVKNKGDIDIYNLKVEDPMLGGEITVAPVGDGNNDGVLNTYETWVYTIDYQVTQSDINNKGVYNLATVSGKNGANEDLDPETSVDPTPLDPSSPNYDPTRPDHTFVPLKGGSLLITNPMIYQKTK